MKSGFYWAKAKDDGKWYFVEIEEYVDRIPCNIEHAQGDYCVLEYIPVRKHYVWHIGSDNPDRIEYYSEFVSAVLIDPDNIIHKTSEPE